MGCVPTKQLARTRAKTRSGRYHFPLLGDLPVDVMGVILLFACPVDGSRHHPRILMLRTLSRKLNGAALDIMAQTPRAPATGVSPARANALRLLCTRIERDRGRGARRHPASPRPSAPLPDCLRWIADYLPDGMFAVLAHVGCVRNRNGTGTDELGLGLGPGLGLWTCGTECAVRRTGIKGFLAAVWGPLIAAYTQAHAGRIGNAIKVATTL